MRRPIWNPAWHREGESFWSAANKVAFANFWSVPEAVRVLSGVTGPLQRLLFVSASVDVAVAVCKVLRISAAVARQLFTSLGTMSLVDRQYLSLSLRWCPACLQQGFHSGIFQDWRVWTCPRHGQNLLERCPNCLRGVDPLCALPWTCSYCQHELFRPDQSWVPAFRSPIDFQWSSLEKSTLLQIDEVRESPVNTHYYSRGSFAKGSSPEKVALATQAAEWAYEEAAALTDSLLCGHRDCVANHVQASMVQFDPVHFSCPVAGALTHVGAWFDFQAMGVSGSWVGGIRPAPGLVNSWLEWELREVPGWARRLYVRESFRAWLMDAIANFKAADDLGLQTVSWRPQMASGATLTSVDDKIVLKSHCDWPGFSKLIEQGAISCAASRRA